MLPLPRASRRPFDGALGGVKAGYRIIEEHHDPVAGELVERALELPDERPQHAMVFAQEIEHFLRLGGLRKGRVAAQIARRALTKRLWPGC
jgi:hypothetical protein